MLIWFGGIVFIGGTIFVSTLIAVLGGGQIVTTVWMGLGIPLILPLFGYLLLKFGRFLARDEQRFLTDFLRGTIDAHDAAR
jgi:hypothetical protein